MAVTGSMAALAMYQANEEANAAIDSDEFQAKQARFNQELNEIRAQELIAQSKDDILDRQDQVSKMLGTQRVNLAAQGIDIDSDAALQVQIETKEDGTEDVATIKNNAWKEAWGMEVQSQNEVMNAEMRVNEAEVNKFNSLVSAGAQGASQMYGGYSKSSQRSITQGRPKFS